VADHTDSTPKSQPVAVTPAEKPYPDTLRAYAAFVRGCWNCMSRAEADIVVREINTAAARIEQLERQLNIAVRERDADFDVLTKMRERAEKAEAALRELVRLKDLNRRIHSPKEFKADPDGYLAAIDEYERCSTAAWESVRAIVKERPHGQ
jgi:hypothetical protein